MIINSASLLKLKCEFVQNQDLILILKSNYIYECNADVNQESTNE
jgi:hypothetical protein